MSTPHCPRRARRARLAALALAVALPAAACTDPNWSPNLDPPFDAMGDDGQVPARGEGEHAEVPSAPGTVRGWVTFGHPVEAATVVVLGEDGEQVGSEATTDELGYFETDAPYGPDYTVVATGGTLTGGEHEGQPLPVTLRTRMNTDDPESRANVGYVDVNMASTLVAEHLDRHPELDEEEAEAHVASTLGAHPDTDLNAQVGVDPSAFRPAALTPEDPEAELDDDVVDRVADAVAAGQAPEGAFVLSNPVSGMAMDIVADFIKGQGAKLLTKALGLEETDQVAAEVRAMRGQLDQLQRALVEVSQRAHQVAVEGIYGAAVDATNDVRGGIRTASRLYLEPVAERAVALTDARVARAKLPPGASDADVRAADERVSAAEEAYRRALTNFRENYNTLAGGAFVKLNLFLESGPGDAKSIVAKYADVLRPKRFISKEDSDALFAVYEDFASWQATAAHLEAEYQSVIGGNVAGAIRLYEEAVERQQAQLPSRLGTPGLVVDLATNRMWAGKGTGLLQWSPGYIGWLMDPTPEGLPAPPAGFSGWRIPDKPELADLVRDRGKSNVRDHMVSISTATGFDRNWWSAWNAPLWTTEEGREKYQIVPDWYTPPRDYYSYNRAVLNVNGSWSVLPYLGPGQGGMGNAAHQHVQSRYDAAKAHVLWVRTLQDGERYL